MHTCTTMHRHCGLHQLCVAPSQVRCSQWLILTGTGGSRLSALELELRQPGISIGAESVPRTGYFAGAGFAKAAFANRVFEGLGFGTDACGYPIL